MGKTIAEKILSTHSGVDAKAGQIVVCDIDFCMGQDGTTGIIIDSFNELGAKKIFDPEKFAVIIDHSSPSPNSGVSAVHKKIRDFTKKYGIRLYDIGEGVCHQLMPEQGLVVPGDLVMGADSHTCTYGAINVFSTGVGSTDLAICAASGKNWFKVPETIKFVCDGSLPKGVYAKDLMLYIIGDVTADGCTYKSAEFCGSTIDDLSIESRFTISNMAIEMGAKCGIMLWDKKTEEWVSKHSKKKQHPVFPDSDAVYADIKEYDFSDLSPQIARPHTVDNVWAVEEVEGLEIHQGLIGTCTNGRLEDFVIAAEILKGRKIKKGCRLIVAPSSKQVYLDMIKTGVLETLVNAGAAVVTPGCGPCVGTHNGVPSDGERVISTANRNFKGRMGNVNAEIYLGSPATVAASMIEGKIADPRKYVGTAPFQGRCPTA